MEIIRRDKSFWERAKKLRVIPRLSSFIQREAFVIPDVQLAFALRATRKRWGSAVQVYIRFNEADGKKI